MVEKDYFTSRGVFKQRAKVTLNIFMLKLLVKLDKDMSTIEVSSQRGKEVLNTTKDTYEKDLSDKIIQGLNRKEFRGILPLNQPVSSVI